MYQKCCSIISVLLMRFCRDSNSIFGKSRFNRKLCNIYRERFKFCRKCKIYRKKKWKFTEKSVKIKNEALTPFHTLISHVCYNIRYTLIHMKLYQTMI